MTRLLTILLVAASLSACTSRLKPCPIDDVGGYEECEIERNKAAVVNASDLRKEGEGGKS